MEAKLNQVEVKEKMKKYKSFEDMLVFLSTSTFLQGELNASLYLQGS